MATLVSRQVGTITLPGDSTTLSVTDTITSVNTANAFVRLLGARGGRFNNNASAPRIELTNSTTVTAFRGAVDAEPIYVEYEVVEFSDFNVQHFSINMSSTATVDQAIASVDLSRSWVIVNGVTETASTGRVNKDVATVHLTSATNARVTMGDIGNGAIVSFVVIEAPASDISSVQSIEVNHDTADKTVTISSVDTSKSLLFVSVRSQSTSQPSDNMLPSVEFVNGTTLDLNNQGAGSLTYSRIHVVEFANLSVTHGSSDATVLSFTDTLAATPTHGSIALNGPYGHLQSLSSTGDAHHRSSWSATLSGDTWTIARHDNTMNPRVRYSTFDWADLNVVDTTPPTFSADPTAGSATTSGHTISATLNESGTIYAVRLADGATAPSSAQVKAGQDSTGSAALEAKSVAATASVSANMVFSTGSASTAYDYYVVAEDDEGSPNVQASPTLVNATTTATTPVITNIDGDNNVQAGQSNVSIVTSGIDPASVTQAVTLGGETLTINSWTDSGGNALINVDIPLHIDLEWGTTHELAVTHDGGTTTLAGVTLSAPTGWETVSFSTIPDTGTTESFYEYSQSDVTVGNFTAQVGDTLAFTSATGLTIDGSSIPVVNPAATVTGSYKWWDASLSTWTPVSSYTITNLGVFGGSDTTVMIQEMISDMISEMVN